MKKGTIQYIFTGKIENCRHNAWRKLVFAVNAKDAVFLSSSISHRNRWKITKDEVRNWMYFPQTVVIHFWGSEFTYGDLTYIYIIERLHEFSSNTFIYSKCRRYCHDMILLVWYKYQLNWGKRTNERNSSPKFHLNLHQHEKWSLAILLGYWGKLYSIHT